ncbi:MAG: hypothetical protein AAFX79_08220 [Planctomycetota bacterium]
MSDRPTDNHEKAPGVMRSLGAFFGEIVRAVKSSPERYEQQDAARDARPPARDGERVVLRRTTTTVDEVVLRPGEREEGRDG